MRTLAIETATEACSLALFEDGSLLAHAHRLLGRGHAEQLVPMIADLPERGKADRILVSLGPGSFTGVRIGIATARALGIAWGARVFGYPTLAIVAAAAFANDPGTTSTGVAMTGGHGEWFVQSFGSDGLPLSDHASLRPDEAAVVLRDERVAGSRADELVALRGTGEAFATLPDARLASGLPETLFTADIVPIYGRGPDARLPS